MRNETIKARLLAAGFDEDSVEAIQRHAPGSDRDTLNTRVTRARFAASSGTGFLQTWCGGTIVATFEPDTRSSWRVHLVVDDGDGEAWDVRLRAGENPLTKGPRPHAVLKLVSSV